MDLRKSTSTQAQLHLPVRRHPGTKGPGPMRPTDSVAPVSCKGLRMYLVDAHPVVRESLCQHLEKELGLQLCGWSEDSSKALAELPDLKPDLVIVELTLNGSHGVAFVRDLLIVLPKLKVLVFSTHEEKLSAPRLLEAGALGYLRKSANLAQVTEAVRKVLAGEVYLSPEMIARDSSNKAAGRLKPPAGLALVKLSARELQVFELIGQGLETRQIAEQLKLAIKSIETYRARIKEKLSLPSAPALLRAAFQFVQSAAAPSTPETPA